MVDYRDQGYLRDVAEAYNIPLTGNEDTDDLVTKVSEGMLEESVILAFAIKFGEEYDGWNSDQWREVAQYLGPEKALTPPLFTWGYEVILADIVDKKFPRLSGNYDGTFVRDLVGNTMGDPERIEAVIEQLAEFHSGYSMAGVTYNTDMLRKLHDLKIVKL